MKKGKKKKNSKNHAGESWTPSDMILTKQHKEKGCM